VLLAASISCATNAACFGLAGVCAASRPLVWIGVASLVAAEALGVLALIARMATG
jgi:hypothetical protein